MKKTLMAMILAALVAIGGCTTLSNDSATNNFAVQYATMKLIEESDTVDAQGVLHATSQIRTIVERDKVVDLTTLSTSFREQVDLSALSPSDQLLVSALVSRVQETINSRVSVGVSDITAPDEYRVAVLQLLNDVDEAAFIYK